MTKESLNMFSLGAFAFSCTPMALFTEQQYYFAVPSFLIGLLFQTLLPTAKELIRDSQWYRHNTFFVYPALCVSSAILGLFDMEFLVILLVFLYIFWSNAMFGKIRQHYFPEESAGESNNQDS